ncbi:SPOSA6832_04172, partial [Sporobolomyces salmonicolor]
MATLTHSSSSHHMGDAPPTNSLSHSSSSHAVTHQPASTLQQQQTQHQQQAQSQAEDPVFGPLEKAGKVLEERLARDERWTGIGASSSDYVLPPNQAWAPFTKTRTVLLPDRLFEEHDRVSSFSTFEELTDVIVGVALVRPRSGVFVDSISHLLVLATPSQITLVGLGYAAPSPGAKKEVTFYLTGLSVPTDGISFTTIRGTSNGRIFLASSPEPLTPGGIGGDGCLYELAYQSSEGWFAKRCTLHNLTSGSIVKSVVPSFLRSFSAVPTNEWIIALEVDNERGLLYTLLRNSTIEMYSLPSSSPGKGFDGPPSKVAKSADVVRTANMLLPNNPMIKNFRIVELEVISVREGGQNKVGLVAVTNTGVRLYFTHQRRSYYYGVSSSPASLELCHVRPPPAPTTPQPPPPSGIYGQVVPSNSQPQAPANQIPFNSIIQARYSSGGHFLAANNLTPDLDVLLVAAPDIAASARSIAESGVTGTAQGSRPFTEVAGTIEISGRTWDMAEITARPLVVASGGTGLNELATQPTQPKREWVVLTNMGANVISRQRPVDTLLDVLTSASAAGNGGHGEIGVFFESYGRDQSCAMLLTIAAGNSQLQLAESADVPSGMSGFASINARTATSTVADQAKALFFEGGGRPVSIDRGGYGSGSQGQASDSKIIFSGRHEGLAFYFARLIRPIWKQKITRPSPSPSEPARQGTNVPDVVLSAVQRDLIALRSFVEQEHLLFTHVPDSSRSSPSSAAYQAEQASLGSLRLLLTQSVEAISFILLLIDYQLPEIVASCAPELQKQLLELTYAELLTSKRGRDVARGLVSAVINQQIGRHLSVDAISETLQQRCGSFCSADDVLLYKAIEAMRRAKDTPDSMERTECLRESLRLVHFACPTTTRKLTLLAPGQAVHEGRTTPVVGTSERHLLRVHLDEIPSRCADFMPLGFAFLLTSSLQNRRDRPRPLLRSGMGRLRPRRLVLGRRLPAERPSRSGVRATAKMQSARLRSARCNGRLAQRGFEAESPGWLSLVYGVFSHSAVMIINLLWSMQTRKRTAFAPMPTTRRFRLRMTSSTSSSTSDSHALPRGLPHPRTNDAREDRPPLAVLRPDFSLYRRRFRPRFPRRDRCVSPVVYLVFCLDTHLYMLSSFPLSLQKRVEYLSLAVGNAKSQAPSGSRGDSVQFLTDVEEKLEVAQVQIEVFRAIEDSNMDPEEKRAWLEKVEDRLFTITELYSEFAEPLELLEIILLIFHVSDHRDPFLVTATWEAILARAQDEHPDDPLDAVAAKVIQLGHRFHASDVSFPLPDLIALLERFGYERKAESRPGWVALAIHEAGVPFEAIFAVFDELMMAKIPPWHTATGLAFLAADVAELLSAWLSEANSAPASASRSFPATEVESAIGKYLMSLQSATNAGAVVAKLQDLQRSIRRRY